MKECRKTWNNHFKKEEIKVEIKESSLIKNNKKNSENNEELHDFDEVLRGDFMYVLRQINIISLLLLLL
jgi:hypothetical protein